MTILGPGQSTPAPWINVIANSTFGFQTATEGSGYTWSGNSRENQLTPWSNDPVSDPPGEAFYIRDDKTGDVWIPTAVPIRDPSGDLYRPSWPGLQPLRAQRAWRRLHSSPVRAGRRIDKDIAPPVDEQIEPHTSSQRDRCRVGARHVGIHHARICRNRERRHDRRTFRTQPRECVVRLACRFRRHARRTNRLDGRSSRVHRPQPDASRIRPALASASPLSKKVGAALDPCAAMRTKLELQPGSVAEVVFFLGEAATREDARAAIQAFRAADLDALEADIARNLG